MIIVSYIMLIKLMFLVFFIENALCSSSDSIESKWSKFEIAIKNQFKQFFDQQLVSNLNTVLNNKYESEISSTCKTSLIKLIGSLGEMEPWAIKSKFFLLYRARYFAWLAFVEFSFRFPYLQL